MDSFFVSVNIDLFINAIMQLMETEICLVEIEDMHGVVENDGAVYFS